MARMSLLRAVGDRLLLGVRMRVRWWAAPWRLDPARVTRPLAPRPLRLSVGPWFTRLIR